MSAGTSEVVWMVGNKEYNETDLKFLSQIENNLCLYCGPSSKVFSKYRIHKVKSESNKVVALPYEDFSSYRIPSEAIKPLSMFVIPSKVAANDASDLRIVFKSAETGDLRSVGFKKGMDKLAERFKDSGEFYPVILNSDLKGVGSKTPSFKLHRLDIDAIPMLSPAEKDTIRDAFQRKMQALSR
jgi:hypothetical protein